LSRGLKENRILLLTFCLGVVASLVLLGVLSSVTESVLLKGYSVINTASASSESGDQGGGEGKGDGDQGGGGETDFQPDSDTEGIETTGETETDEDS
jgi:hypothetical protein